ncbi:MAG: AmmeMemoRadiSam system protein B [Desulfarculus sp.]|nr:AmmeMemoRadiSam system protein B [Desulfarculus sp.]
MRPRPIPSLALALALCLLAGAQFAAGAAPPAETRPATLAGTWYPADPSVLAGSLEAFLRLGRGSRPEGKVVALVVPHAGHRYSGSVAGAAYALAQTLDPPPRAVIRVGPSHHFPLEKPSIWPSGSFDTPLGSIPVDQALAAELTRRLGAGFRREADLREHSLEVQMPFLCSALPQASPVTVLTGRPDLQQARQLGAALAAVARDRPVLLVASTDLSHFHPRAKAQELDARVAGRVQALDGPGLLSDDAAGRSEACGAQALAAVLLAAQELGATQGQVLAQADSGRATQDYSQVVGYMSAALVAPPAPQADKPATAGGLDAAQQKRLRDLARQAVAAAVRGQALPAIPQDDPALLQPAGVFVTLKKGHDLRGCIGAIVARRPLAREVVAMAVEAALRDPRFPPVSPGELQGLELELSVLSPMQPCRPEEVRVGLDGLLIEGRGATGVLLPQVPVEQGWDRRQYLEGICRKAGLPQGAWREPGVRLQCFQAQVF